MMKHPARAGGATEFPVESVRPMDLQRVAAVRKVGGGPAVAERVTGRHRVVAQVLVVAGPGRDAEWRPGRAGAEEFVAGGERQFEAPAAIAQRAVHGEFIG